jgi:hypothetical protein
MYQPTKQNQPTKKTRPFEPRLVEIWSFAFSSYTMLESTDLLRNNCDSGGLLK